MPPMVPGEDTETLGPEAVVEHNDRSHLVRGGEVGRVVDHGNQVLHLGSSPVVRGAPRGRPLTSATNTSAPIRHRLPDFFPGLSGTPAVASAHAAQPVSISSRTSVTPASQITCMSSSGGG